MSRCDQGRSARYRNSRDGKGRIKPLHPVPPAAASLRWRASESKIAPERRDFKAGGHRSLNS
jgi:hypothetical protein